MNLPRRAAVVRGDDYQHAVAWLWVCRMLQPAERILSISVEDAEGGAFDDVVVRREIRGNIYIQVKSSNYGNRVINGDWLLTRTSAGGVSPLQHFHDTYLHLCEAGERFTLELWTNRGFDHNHPLLGGLLDKKHDKMMTGQMIDAGPKSAIGGERDAWADHLQVDVRGLASFLDSVRWKHPGSEPDIRGQAKPLMELAGLRSDDAAVGTGLGIVRNWVSDGVGPQLMEDVGRCAAEMELTILDRLADPSPGDMNPVELGLPPPCQVWIKKLNDVSPDVADCVCDLLGQQSSLIPGVLDHMAVRPPDWMLDAGCLVWEVLAEFVQAHRLPGLQEIGRRAIEAGSSRSIRHRLRIAMAAINEDEDSERTQELLQDIPAGKSLTEAVKAHIQSDAETVIGAVSGSMLHQSEDPDLACYGSELLGWAHWQLGELESACKVLQQASDRFSDGGYLLLQQARAKFALAQRDDDPDSWQHAPLESAVALAVQARDEFRRWRGPSANAVAVATSALMLLEQPERVCRLAMLPPEGEAEPQEASHAGVVEPLVHALLELGRFDELDKLDLELVGGSEETLIRAFQARARGDFNAVELMREAVDQAEEPRAQTMALEGLALFGETDETALAALAADDVTAAHLIRVTAAYHRGDFATASEMLMPYRCRSARHAALLAECQQRSGAFEQACETLLECAEALDDPSLHSSATTLLITMGDHRKAEEVALGALARNPPRPVESQLRQALVHAAEALQDWPAMEQYARHLVQRFPDVEMGLWAVVYTLHQQAQNRKAWGFIVEHDMSPDNEDAALLAVNIYIAMDSPVQDADRLLRIARAFPESEEVAGNAIAALMIGKGGRVKLSEHQLSELHDLLDGFEQLYPKSSVLRCHSLDSDEEQEQRIRDLTEKHSLDIEPILSGVRDGRLPYGVLRVIRPLPYAESLQLRAAGYLTAVSCDSDTRRRERSAVRASIGQAVAVDTSVAALGMLAELDVERMGAAFDRVLIADELLIDAHEAVDSAGTPAGAYAGYEPMIDDVIVSEVKPEELRQAVKATQQIANTLSHWQRVPSARLEFKDRPQQAALKPWDSSLRVALNKGCPLWCDDAALRHLAESDGITTFGTYALYEVLVIEQGNEWLHHPTDMKTRLLRAGIADVPISLPELREATDDRNGSDPAVGLFLGRPFSWRDPSETFPWYVDRVATLKAAAMSQRIPGLLFEASCGLGVAVDSEHRPAALGELLAVTLWTACDPKISPKLITSSRVAARRIDFSAYVDPLNDTVTQLSEFLEEHVEADTAAQYIMSIFSTADTADKLTVASALFT